MFKGKPIDKKLNINQNDPWYQVLWLGIEEFSKSNKQSQNFWVIKYDNLEPIFMTISRENNEFIEINGNSIHSTRLHLSLEGLMAMFWSCKVWVRPDDGQMLVFKDEGKQRLVTLYNEE